MDMIDKFLTRMYVTNADFVFSVPRDVVQGCRAPVLVIPDETPSHPYEPPSSRRCWPRNPSRPSFRGRTPRRHVRTFLKAHRPA
jgi:hypothetical protein